MSAQGSNGRGSPWRFLSRRLTLCFLMVAFLLGGIGSALAAATITVKFSNLPNIPNLALISAEAVEAETGRLLASASLRKQSAQARLKVNAVPQIVFADLFTSNGDVLSGHSHVLRPVDRKNMIATLQLSQESSVAYSESTTLFDRPFSPFLDAAWPPADISLVGVPSSGLTVGGVDLSTRDVARMLTTDLANTPCYNQAGGYAVVLTDPEDLAVVQAEIDFSNSTWVDPSTRLQNLYVLPSYFINGSWDSDGTTLTVTYRLVDSQGNELVSKSDTGPADNIFNIHSKVMKDLAKDICCSKSKKIKCAKTGSIDIDVDYDILHPDCPKDHQSIQGNIILSLLPVLTDAQNVCEYIGSGISYFKSDAECVDGLFQHVTCTVTETIKGKVPKPAFPFCNNLVVDFVELWDCIEVDPVGTHPYTSPATWTENFRYVNGFVVEYPLSSPFLVGHDRMILHLK